MSQRERLLEGLVQAVSREGFAGASVAKVVERAGVSRATFYTHFSDREDCYLEAWREIGACLRAQVRSVESGQLEPGTLREVLAALLEGAASHSAAAHLVLIDAFGAPRAVRAEQERLLTDLEFAIEPGLREQRDGWPALQISARALMGGIVGVLAIRVLRGEASSLPSHLDDLLAWLDSYALPVGCRPWSYERWQTWGRGAFAPCRQLEPADVKPLPRGRNALPAESVAAVRRQRIMAATTRIGAVKGYAALSVDDIVAEARITRSIFYSHFRSKQEAFMAVHMRSLQESISRAAAEFAVGGGWPERGWRALRAFLTYIAEDPDRAMLGFAEVHAAGEAALLRDHDYRLAYALFLSEGYQQSAEAARLPPICSEAIAGALHALIRERVLAGRTESMLELLPQCVYVCLAPFLGPARTIEFIEAQLQAVAAAA